jgi:hypothetical protein
MRIRAPMSELAQRHYDRFKDDAAERKPAP